MIFIILYVFFMFVATGIVISRCNDPNDDIEWWIATIYIVGAPIAIPIQFGIYANDWYTSKIK